MKLLGPLAIVFVCSSAFSQISVTRDCGVIGYPADDTATIQACLDDHPGTHIVFQK